MTSERADPSPDQPGGDAAAKATAVAVIDEAGRQLRAPWAAGIAGLPFAVLFTGALRVP